MKILLVVQPWRNTNNKAGGLFANANSNKGGFFGQQAFAGFGQQNNGNSFGTFGQKNNGNAFGASGQNNMTTTAFGGPFANAVTTGFGLFGQSGVQQQASATDGLAGQSQEPQQQPQQQAQTGTAHFGAMASQSGGQEQQTAPSGGLFGAASSLFGSTGQTQPESGTDGLEDDDFEDITPSSWSSDKPTTVVRESALARAYTVDGRASVPSDGTAHQVLVATLPFESKVSHVSVPRAERAVYVVCEVTNGSAYRLDAGSVRVFLDDSFVAKTQIKVCARCVQVDRIFVDFFGEGRQHKRNVYLHSRPRPLHRHYIHTHCDARKGRRRCLR
jgi:hypothetical protein